MPRKRGGGKREEKICEECHKKFKVYDDGKGGDIGKRICRDCSCDRYQDIDRSVPKNMEKYMTEICPFY